MTRTLDAAPTPAVQVSADVRPERARSADPADFPDVDSRVEEWKFTPLDRLKPLLDGGDVVGGLSTTISSHEGVSLLEPGPAGDLPLPIDMLAARAHGAVTAGIRVAEGTDVAEPVLVRRTGTGGPATDHLVVELGRHSRATVVLEHTGSTHLVGKVSVVLADGASLDLVQVRAWDADALEATHVATRLGRDARMRSTAVTLGGSLVRVVETIDFTGPGGDVELRGLSLADDGQHLEHRLLVDHSVPHCRSRVTYKNALQGDDARTVWIGDVLIRAAAVGTDTYEFNRNLLLTPAARADSVPNLEIETGEISGAGHASATGRFDDEQLFYLQSRGIPGDVARRMVVRGFFAEIIESIGVPALQASLMAEVERGLGQVRDDEADLLEASS